MKMMLLLLIGSLCFSQQTAEPMEVFAAAWQAAIKASISRQLEDKQSIGDKEELQQMAPYYNADQISYRLDFLRYLQSVNPPLWQQVQHEDVLLLDVSESGERVIERVVVVLKSGHGYQAYHFSATRNWQFDKTDVWTSEKMNAARNAKRCPYAGCNGDDVVVTARLNQTGQFVSEFFARGSLCSDAIAHGNWIDEGWK